jgi:hypothetical protein
MRALVVYESIYGNTHAVATAIAAALSATHEVTLVPVSRATPELVVGADLIAPAGPSRWCPSRRNPGKTKNGGRLVSAAPVLLTTGSVKRCSVKRGQRGAP